MINYTKFFFYLKEQTVDVFTPQQSVLDWVSLQLVVLNKIKLKKGKENKIRKSSEKLNFLFPSASYSANYVFLHYPQARRRRNHNMVANKVGIPPTPSLTLRGGCTHLMQPCCDFFRNIYSLKKLNFLLICLCLFNLILTLFISFYFI